MGGLTAAAHFWAMRSCKYLKVTKTEQRQMKQLCLCNIAFIKNGKNLDRSSTKLHLADCISVTFERQKNNRKSDTLTQWRTKDPILCPVKIWASIVTRILLYEGTNKNSPIYLVLHRKKLISVTSEMITNLIRDGVVAIGETKLGIERWEIGTHSNSIQCSHGNVPCRRPNFFHNVNWTMVHHGIPQIHLEAGARIFARHLVENDRNPVFQACPEPAYES
jgi:hypothetical protein